MKDLSALNETWIDTAPFSVANAELFESELEKVVSNLDNELKDLEQRVANVRADTNLSKSGQDKKIAEIYGEKASYIQTMEENIRTKTLQAINKEEHVLAKALSENTFSTGHPAADEVRAREIRSWFNLQDPALRENIYLEAVSQGDTELTTAIERAPACFKLLPQSLITEGKRRRAAMVKPESATMHNDLKLLGEVSGHNFTRAKKALEPYRNIAMAADPEKFDPVIRMGQGRQ